MARDAFSVDGKLNFDELVAFTELVQKSFKIAGASTSGTTSSNETISSSDGILADFKVMN